MNESLGPFQFSSPPRYLPLSMRFSHWFNGGSQIALVWILFSTPFFWVFGAQADLSGLTFRGAETTQGVVTKVIETGASEDDMTVWVVHFDYRAQGERLSGSSYVTGSPPASGDAVTVLYDEDDPTRSKAEGMRKSMFGPMALIVIIFPAIGLLGLWFTVKWGIRRNRLLAHGVLTEGQLERNVPTNTTINDKRVMALTFGFTDKDGHKRSAEIRTTDTKWLTDEDREQILYDPQSPDKALALDELDPFPDLDETGSMLGNPKRAALRAIVPALTVLANWYFVQRLFD